MNEDVFCLTTIEHDDKSNTVYDIGIFTEFDKAVKYGKKYKRKFPRDRVFVYRQSLDAEFDEDDDFTYTEEDNNCVEVVE